VKIEKLFVYPVRGIRSPHPVPEVMLGPHGIKYDREIMLIDCETRRHCTSANEKQMACLTQTLVGNQVVISTTNPERLGDLSKTLKLDLDITKPVGPLFKGLKHEGH
jgi:uncharacterized protein YcbX